MSITGKSVKSLRKTDLINQKQPAVGFKKISFAHKAALNDAGFNLTALTLPTELTSNGFSQPSGSELASISLQFYAKNLTLTSAARGMLVPFQDYTIGGNQQINFTAYFGTALADEIFYGTIDPVAKTGSLIADTNFILKTGTLSAGATDFNVGGSWKTNINPNMQLGAVSVYLDGVLQFRNAGNATAAPSADGNYQEVDNGSGDCTLVKFNIADDLNDRVCMVMSNAISVVRPDGSVNDSIEKIQGSLDAVISTVADLAGVATTNFNASPTTPQLKQYGDRVIALESGAMTIAGSKTFSSSVTMSNDIIMADGKGIDFSAFTDSSVAGTTTNQVLKDYEEGTWVPVFTTSGTAPTGVTYAGGGQLGIYTKVGRLVTCSGYILLTSKGAGGTGIVKITGLPYVTNSNGASNGFAGLSYYSGYTTSVIAPYGFPPAGTAFLYMEHQIAASTGELDTIWDDVSNTWQIGFSLTYMV